MPADQSIHHTDPQRKASEQPLNRAAPSSNSQSASSDAKVWAEHYHALGMNIVPWGPDKTPAQLRSGKRFEWRQWQEQRQTSAHIANFPWDKATGVAAICGPISDNLVCVDFDHPEDDQALNLFLDQLPLPLDYAWIVRSPGGGYHVWLLSPGLDLGGKHRLDRRLRGEAHVELRFTKHCTALPPTYDSRGKHYEFLNGGMPSTAPMTVDPKGLLRAYDIITGMSSSVQPARSTPHAQHSATQYALAALQNESEAVRAASPGTRNNTLNSAAYSLGQLVSAGELDRGQVEGELLQAATTSGLSGHEVTATIRSGIDAGVAHPRQGRTRIIRSLSKHSTSPSLDSQKTIPSRKGRPTTNKLLIRDLANAISSDNHFARDGGDKLYRYHEGVYRPDGERYIEKCVKDQLRSWQMEGDWSTHRTREVIAYIRTDAPLLWEVPPMDTLNVLNGLVDVATAKLRQHSPDFLSPVQLPVTYDPSAVPSYWDQFCCSTFPEDAYSAGVHWQIVAWLMLPNTSLQKSLMLLGDGGNGKSRYLAGVKAFLGDSHVTALPLQKIEADRFACVRLLGKLANICPDLPSQHLQDTSVFKQLTGDDGRLTGERKGQDSFEFPVFARLVFSANYPPKSNDMSEGFYRRWIVLPFDRTFANSDRIASNEIDKQLAQPEELSGVLNMALQFLPQVLENGITETESMRQAHSAFREVTDPLAIWLESQTFLDDRVCIGKDALRRRYNETPGMPFLSAKAFTAALKRHRPKLTEKQRTWDGNAKQWVYIGIGCHDLYQKLDN